MILYDNVRARWRERDKVRVLAVGDEDMTPDNFERLQEAENQYRDLASQVRAFADTQSPTPFSDGSALMRVRLRPLRGTILRPAVDPNRDPAKPFHWNKPMK
jgi:hypothetical protein